MPTQDGWKNAPPWIWPVAFILILLVLFMMWIFQLKIKIGETEIGVVTNVETPHSCPYESALRDYGFCFWFDGAKKRTFEQARNYCKSNGARLCTHSELVAAQAMGASNCTEGWIAEMSKDGKSARSGFLRQNPPVKNCGTYVVQIEERELSSVLGAYCCR